MGANKVGDLGCSPKILGSHTISINNLQTLVEARTSMVKELKTEYVRKQSGLATISSFR